MREEWSVYDLGQHTRQCTVWDDDEGVCECGGNEKRWRGKDSGVPHPQWYDFEIVRRVLNYEPTGRPVSESEAMACLPQLAGKLSILEIAERMCVDRRWVDKWIGKMSEDMV